MILLLLVTHPLTTRDGFDQTHMKLQSFMKACRMPSELLGDQEHVDR